MFKRRKSIVLSAVVLCVLLNLDGYTAQSRRGQRGQQRRSNQNSQTSRPESSLPGDLQQAYLNAIGEQQVSDYPTTTPPPPSNSGPGRGSNSWDRFTPSVPTIANSDCFVVVEERRRGRCSRLGGYRLGPYICLSGSNFEFQPDCERKIAERQQYHNPSK